jgi:hypothetical protein
MGIAAQERDDLGDKAKLRRAMVGFPIPDRRYSHADLLGRLPLQQAQIEASFAHMVAERPQLGWIGEGAGLTGGQREMAKGQRNPVRVATMEIRPMSVLAPTA